MALLRPDDRHYGEEARQRLWTRKAELEKELREVNFLIRAADRMLKPLSEKKQRQLEDARQALKELPDSSGSS